GR
ncbi:hypothetical protein ANME2D_03122, partial [Candidatus Methanoperedens nitroreducens]